MRKPEARTVITFHTTAEAIATESACRRLGLEGKLISVPRSVTSDCGLAWSAPPELEARLREVLAEGGVDEAMIRSVCSHGYGLCSDIKPEHLMEKVLFASDELTGLIGAAALMRPSKSVQDMELKSLKKKYKDKKFAAGCSREVIAQGAEMLGWELDTLLEKTLEAMRSCEAGVAAELESIK